MIPGYDRPSVNRQVIGSSPVAVAQVYVPDLGLIHSLSRGLAGLAHGIRELHRDEGARPGCGEPGMDSAERRRRQLPLPVGLQP